MMKTERKAIERMMHREAQFSQKKGFYWKLACFLWRVGELVSRGL